MDSTCFPTPDLAEAEARVARAQSDLDAKRTAARRIAEHIDWLKSRPELERLHYLVTNHARLQAQLAREEEEYRAALGQREQEIAKTCPFEPPRHLEEEIEHIRWLLQELTPHISPRRLESVLNDPRLTDADKQRLSARMRSACCDSEWAAYIDWLRERLHRKKQELEVLEHAHQAKLRLSALEQLRPLQNHRDGTAAALAESAAAVARQPEIEQHIAACVDQYVFDETQGEEAAYDGATQHLTHQIEVTLQSLFALPATDPCILRTDVHAFLKCHHHRLAPYFAISTPLGVSHLARLIAGGDYAGAGELVTWLPTGDTSSLGQVVAYLRYIVSATPELSGTTAYRDLSQHDVFLGACYYDNGPASEALNQVLQWDYASLQHVLSQHELNKFKGLGLQPRIAELAFESVYRRTHGLVPGPQLHDVNLQCMRPLRRPWSLGARPVLPGHDWEDVNGKKYDVKCNVFYRTMQKSKGLCGFLIERVQAQCHTYPGFVFTKADETCCTWVYVGDYVPGADINLEGDRVLPFCFRLPDCMRYTACVGFGTAELGHLILNDRFLRVGWQLVTGVRGACPQEHGRAEEALLHDLVEKCVRACASGFLEQVLWKVLTETTLDACSKYDSDTVDAYLELVGKVVESGVLPVRLPQIGGKPILDYWIEQVLCPLNHYWDRVQCPACGARAAERGTVVVQVQRMTSAGTIYGRIMCNVCGYVCVGATLLTHCHGCSHYPLLVRKNPVCGNCKGLVCEWKGRGGTRCRRCKRGCRGGQDVREADFLLEADGGGAGTEETGF
jgi:hypothetical protein